MKSKRYANVEGQAVLLGNAEPGMVPTSMGELPVDSLEKRCGVRDGELDTEFWVEFYLMGKRVHSSAHKALKKSVVMAGEAAKF